MSARARLETHRVCKEADSEAERILSEARARVGEILKAAHEEAKRMAISRREGAEADSDLQAAIITQKATAEAVEKQSKAVEGLVAKGLKAKRDDVIKSAVKRFSESVPIKEMEVFAAKSDEKQLRKLGISNVKYSKGTELTLCQRMAAYACAICLKGYRSSTGTQ